MADIREENNVFGGVQFENGNGNTNFEGENNNNVNNGQQLAGNKKTSLVKQGFWSKFKAFWFQEIDWNKEIKVELNPYQQKVENEINEFLHQDITWEKVHDFLFQEVSFGKKKANV